MKEEIGRARRGDVYLGVIAVTAVALILVGRQYVAAEQAPPRNVALLAKAWGAFNTEKWELAVTRADEMLDEFSDQALRQQEELAAQGTPKPPTGKVTDAQKEAIDARGVINDVATAYWIKGKSLERLDRNAEATTAYEAAVRLSYGRCWDPNGWFWSPAESAGDRLRKLRSS